MNDSDLYGSLTYDDAAAAIDWLCKAFGFTSRLVVSGPDGTVIHSELTLGKAVVMVSSPKPDFGRVGQRSLAGSSYSLCLRVDDPDSHFNVSRQAAATIVQEARDEDYGSRGYMARDVEGHLVLWNLSPRCPLVSAVNGHLLPGNSVKCVLLRQSSSLRRVPAAVII